MHMCQNKLLHLHRQLLSIKFVLEDATNHVLLKPLARYTVDEWQRYFAFV